MMKTLPRRYLLTVLASSLFLPLAQSAPLPTTAQLQSAAQASFKDGVLEITVPLPQRESPQGRRIEIR